MSTPIRVAILDDHEFILHSIRSLAAGHPRIEIVVSGTDSAAFLAAAATDAPDVAVVDLQMHGRVTGHETIAALTELGIRSLVLTADQRRLPVRLAMQAGSRGLVLKGDPASELHRAIEEVHDTGWAQSSALAAAVLADSQDVPALTKQELVCLRLAGEGVPVKAIGRQFDPPISLGTVKTYLARAYEKYAAVGRSVANTTQATMEAAADGWFDI